MSPALASAAALPVPGRALQQLTARLGQGWGGSCIRHPRTAFSHATTPRHEQEVATSWGTHPAAQQLPSGRTSQGQPRSEHRREEEPRQLLAPGYPEGVSSVLVPQTPLQSGEECLRLPTQPSLLAWLCQDTGEPRPSSGRR